MPNAIPQRIITLTLVGTDETTDVYYTYLSPVTGLSYTNCPVCDMVADQAVNTLFVLDYVSTLNGWTITGLHARKGYPSLEAVPGALNLSIMTINPYTSMETYQYYIRYSNTVNGVEIERDPQQGNIPKPHIDKAVKTSL
jgi:hypothetical protein